MKSITKLALVLWSGFLRGRLKAELPAGAREYKEFQALAFDPPSIRILREPAFRCPRQWEG